MVMQKVPGKQNLFALPAATPALSATSATNFDAFRHEENQPTREQAHPLHAYPSKRRVIGSVSPRKFMITSCVISKNNFRNAEAQSAAVIGQVRNENKNSP
jgi:hypothetical protein